MITWVRWVAKAVTAAVVIGLAEVARLNIEMPAWVLVVAAMVVAFLGVFLVPNGSAPE